MSTVTNTSAVSTGQMIPPAVRNWLKSQYCSAQIKESWLAQTVASASGTTSGPGLVQHVKQALLNSSLSESTETGVLANDKSKAVLGDAVLLEIVGKLDIGVSAQAQLDVLEARSQARQTAGGAAQLEEANKGDNNANEQPDHMADFNASEEAASLPATVFPRSSTMQLTLSDGHTTIQAFEHRRLPWLTMTEPPLGSKVVLRGAKVHSGHVLLTQECIELKGGRVESMDNEWEENMIDELRGKLGKPRRTKRQKDRDANGAHQANDVVHEADADEDEEAALFEAMQGGEVSPKKSTAAASGSGTSCASTKRIKLPPKNSASASSESRQAQPQKNRSSSATPSKSLQNQVDTTKSPYFTSASTKAQVSSDQDPPATLKADSDDFYNDEEDDFEMLLPNDIANPIVLSDSE